MQQRKGVSALLVVGSILLVNPLYLDGLLVYPTGGDGFAIGGLYYAAVAGLGLVSVLAGLSMVLSLPERHGVATTISAIAIATVVLFVGYSRIVFGLVDVGETRILGYGHRKTFVVSVAAALFVAGGAVAGRRPSGLMGIPLVIGLGLVFVRTSRTGIHFPLLYFDLALLIAKSDLLGIPYLGGVILSIAGWVGGAFGFYGRKRRVLALPNDARG